MVTIRYGQKNLINLGFVLLICFGGSLLFLAGLLRRWLVDCSVPVHIMALTVFVVGGMLLLGLHHLKLYRRESKVVGVSSDGVHLSSGKIYRFDEAQSILPVGYMGFRIQFNDGWFFQPAYLNTDVANEVFHVIKLSIESSPRKLEFIAAINAQLKKQHNAGAQSIIFCSALLIMLPFLPFMSMAHPLPLILVGIIPFSYGLYKRFRQPPKSFDTLRGVGKIEF